VRYLEASDSKQPNATTKLHLGSSYLKVGDRVRGVGMLQAAIAMDPKLVQSKTFQETAAGVSIR
jgi:Tfp pilus assembly protein PilF